MKTVTFNGKTYPSLKNFCEVNGHSYKKVHSRLKNGVSLEEAVLDRIPRAGREITYKGRVYHNLTDFCSQNGFDYLPCRVNSIQTCFGW